MYKKLIQMLIEAKTRDDINKVCGAVDRAYQSDKITFKDNEQMYALISMKCSMIGRNDLIAAIVKRQGMIVEGIACANEQNQVESLKARHDELEKVIDYINQH